jgi:hypothetical protein
MGIAFPKTAKVSIDLISFLITHGIAVVIGVVGAKHDVKVAIIMALALAAFGMGRVLWSSRGKV